MQTSPTTHPSTFSSSEEPTLLLPEYQPGRPSEPPGNQVKMPTQIGPYQIERALGRGGMANVFLARTSAAFGFSRRVALKITPSEGVEQTLKESMLIREALILNDLRHPGIVKVHDIGTADGFTYCAMEWLDGWTLRQLLSAGGPLPASVCIELGLRICEVLDYLHGNTDAAPPNAVIHGDLKPTNIMVDRFGRLSLIDFGIASTPCHKNPTVLEYGTPAYMAPEQWKHTQFDQRADIFTLGVVLYESATGQRLFSTTNGRGRVSLTRKNDAHFARFMTMIERCIEPEPDRRFRTVSHLDQTLRDIKRTVWAGPSLEEWLADLSGQI